MENWNPQGPHLPEAEATHGWKKDIVTIGSLIPIYKQFKHNLKHNNLKKNNRENSAYRLYKKCMKNGRDCLHFEPHIPLG